MSIDLGSSPKELRVLLSAGFPFASVLVRTTKAGAPENWPSAVVLIFSDGSTWTATRTGNEAAFAANDTEVNRVLALEDTSVILTAGGMLWARGSVVEK